MDKALHLPRETRRPYRPASPAGHVLLDYPHEHSAPTDSPEKVDARFAAWTNAHLVLVQIAAAFKTIVVQGLSRMDRSVDHRDVSGSQAVATSDLSAVRQVTHLRK